MIEWQVVRQSFLGEDEPESWVACFRRGDGDSAEEYEVMVRYSGRHPDSTERYRHAEELAERDLHAVGIAQGRLRVYRAQRASCAAIHPAPMHLTYTFVLDVGDRVRIVDEHEVTISGVAIKATPGPDGRELLPPERKALIAALKEGRDTAIAEAAIVHLAKVIMGNKGALGPACEEIALDALRCTVGERTQALTVEPQRYGADVARVPAEVGDMLTLYPCLSTRTITPMLERAEVERVPLPSYALVRLESLDEATQSRASATDRDGEFCIGPTRIESPRKLRLSACLPFEPPGDEPSLKIDLLLRSGRQVEPYLDKGSLPPAPSVPDDLRLEDLIGEVVRHVATAVNPDTGEITKLSHSDLLDLHAYAPDEALRGTELGSVLEALPMQAMAWRRGQPSSGLPDDDVWTEEDAQKALDDPQFAPPLAERLAKQFRPRRRAPMTKAEPLRAIGEANDDLARDAHRAHALSAAALADADASAYAELIERQVGFVMSASQDASAWPIDDIVTVGQAMKLVVHVLPDDSSVGRDAAQLLAAMRREGLRRFVAGDGKMRLADKVSIGHLASDLWRPYVGAERTPSLLLHGRGVVVAAVPPDAIPIAPEARPPVQRMEIDGRDVTSEVLGEAMMKYRAALRHGMAVIGKSNATREEKIARMAEFLDKWHGYLFDVHKGGLLQSHEGELEEDRKKALAHVSGNL